MNGNVRTPPEQRGGRLFRFSSRTFQRFMGRAATKNPTFRKKTPEWRHGAGTLYTEESMMLARSIAVFAAAVGLSAPALAGPEWTEMGDAGSTLPGAETPIGMGPLAGIKGELNGAPPPRGATDMADFEDVYRIFIENPKNFSAFIVPNDNGTPTFDTQLWLFDRQGDGVLANDDNTAAGVNGESGFLNFATDGTGAVVDMPGVYFLALSGAGNDARNDVNQRIFNFAVPNEVSGPDGVPGAARRLVQWTGAGDIGEYTIALTGVIFLPPPEAADFNADGCVDSADLAVLLAGWGNGGRTDLNADGLTDAGDLAVLLAAWGCDPTN